MKHSKLLLAVVAALALILASCSSTDDESIVGTTAAGGTDNTNDTSDSNDSTPDTGDDNTGTTASSDVPLELGRGVTADTIKLGATYLDFDFLKDSGLSEQGWGDQELIWNTVADNLNNNGGINGRTVELVTRAYSPVNGVGLSADAQCLELIEDEEVFAVLGGFVGPAETSNECIVSTNATPLIGGNQTPERLEAAEATWLQFGGNRSTRLNIMVDLLDSEGFLEGKRIAIVAALASQDASDLVKELLEAKGANIVYEGVNTSEPGADIAAEDALWDVLGEQIRVNEADAVIAVAGTTSAVRNVNRLDLGTEIWATDSNEVTSLGSSVEASDANGVISVVGLTDQETWEEEGMANDCVAPIAEANPGIELLAPNEMEPGIEQTFRQIFQACRDLAIFAQVAELAGDNLNNETFAQAAEDIGDMDLPGSVFASSSAGKTDLNDAYRLVEWEAPEGGEGDFLPLTELTDNTP
jgi:hypothetical protein